MGGLEKILQDIAKNAEIEASDIEAAANKEIAEIRIQCEKDKLSLTEQATKETQEECMKLSDMLEASAQSEARQIILEAKNKAIEKITNYLKENIKTSEEYFDLLLMLVKNNCIPGDGTMYMNQKDLERLPSDFAEKVNENSQGSISISKNPVDLDSGFIIKYGKIDINCSIDSIFESKKNKLSDIINKSLA